MKHRLDPARTALVLVDAQNDFYHAEGALARGGFDLARRRPFAEATIRLCNGCREAGMLLVGSAFTLISDTAGEALVPQFLRDLEVKPVRGDFQVSKWGHQLMQEIQPVHYIVDKTGPSAFFRTELDLILRHRGIDSVVVAGLNSTRSVVATAYDALSLGGRPVIARDACADYDDRAHTGIMDALEGVLDVRETSEILSNLTSPVAFN